MSWLDTLESKPWYASVAKTFSTLAPDVPTEVWQSVILSEDSSLNPAEQDYAHSGHWGLFQEDVSFPTTAGLPQATVAQLQDPNYNAYVAAIAMEHALKKSGATTYQQMIEASETAGWPGAVSPDETKQRYDALNAVLQMAGKQSAPALTPDVENAGAALEDCSKYWVSDPRFLACQTKNAVNAALSPVGAAINNASNKLGENLLIGGVIIAFISGGFLLLSTAAGVKAPAAVPVPV